MTDINMELPVDQEAEDALLGALIQNPKDVVSCVLGDWHFSDYKNREVFKMMRSLTDGGREANIYALKEALANKASFNGVDERLNYLLGAYYFQVPITTLENKILETYRKRRAISELREEFTRLWHKKESTEDIFSDMMSKITKISDPLLSDGYNLDELMELIRERAANPTKIYGIETGLRAFDVQTHGMQKKEVFILSGQPGSGKSMLAGQLAFGMAELGHPGVFYSLEMSAEALYMRQLSAKLDINTDRMKQGWDMYGELDRVKVAIEKLKEIPLVIREQGNWTPMRLRSDIARLKMQNEIEFVIIDYMDLLQAPGSGDYIEKSEKLIVGLHNLALEFDIAIMTIQSLNKAGFSQNPGMENLSGSHKVAFTVDQAAVLIGDPHEKVKELRWIKIRHSDAKRSMKLMLKKGLPEFVAVVETDDEDEIYPDHTI